MNSPASRSTIAWLLFTSDIIGLLFCFNLAFLVRLEELIDWRSPLLYGLILVYLLGLYLADTYRLEIKLSGLWTSERVLFGILATVTVITSCIYLTGLWGSEPIVGRGILFISVSFFSIWAITWRLLTGKWVKITEEKSRFLVLGSGEKALRFGLEYQSFHAKTDFVFLTKNNLEIDQVAVGSVVTQKSNLAQKLEANQSLIVDNFDNFTIWSQQSWSGVLIDDTVENLSNEMIRELMEMRLRGVYVYSLADFCEQYWQKIPPSYIQDDWFAFTSGFSILHNRVNIKLKKIIDKVAAGLLLLLTLPLLILVAIAIKLDSPGAIFYSQVRTGLNGKKFKVYKFRSMCQNAEQQGIQWAKKRDPRITRVGFLLRLTRIDELPQIWNVLKGDMSLVGPRPERPEFDLQLREEIPYYDVRYLVKPGITGWAQVCYPYGSSVEDAYQKVAYDLYYIKNYSLLLDLKIAFKTLRVVILGKGR
jgi:sugar transferase (PEP-CTERM system associated)